MLILKYRPLSKSSHFLDKLLGSNTPYKAGRFYKLRGTRKQMATMYIIFNTIHMLSMKDRPLSKVTGI